MNKQRAKDGQQFLAIICILIGFATVLVGCTPDKTPQQSRGEDFGTYLPIIKQPADYWIATGIEFQATVLDVVDYRIFDIGVTDLSGDGALDVFTANHSARQSFLINDGRGLFGSNQLSALKLDQALDFPGLEDSFDVPEFTTPGLYIYWLQSALVFHAHEIDAADQMTGSALFFPELDVSSDGAFSYNLTQIPLTNDIVQTLVDFSVLSSGEMIIIPLPVPSVGSPIVFTMDDTVDLNQIFIGVNAVNPTSHTFQVQLKDRHGMAWSDYNDDSFTDVYMTRGGNRGFTDIYPPELVRDEFFLNNGGADFSPIVSSDLGFVKDECAARQVGWVDYNGDGLLDLYIVCARQEENQLYEQDGSGQFTNVARNVNLALRDDGHFAWLDVDGDNDADMFWAGTGTYRIYMNDAGIFSRVEILAHGDRADKLTIADYDQDGDPDVYAASPTESYLFNNGDGVLTPLQPLSIGLPQFAYTANWFDFDNDGLLDLHTVPDGIFQQHSNGSFQALALLNMVPNATPLLEARATWFDADGDGSRDAIISMFLDGFDAGPDEWLTGYFRNIHGETNQWLTITLRGLAGNREAIGALVTVSTADGDYLQGVGWSEGSRYSQGHYTLYFGLDDNEAVNNITVQWPDGSSSQLGMVSAGQHLTITQTSPP